MSVATLYMSTSQKSNQTHKPPDIYSNPPQRFGSESLWGIIGFHSVLFVFESTYSKIIANGCSLDYTGGEKGIKGGL